MRVLQVKLKDGSQILVRCEYQDSQQEPDQTDAVEKVRTALDHSPYISETRVILSR